jgi:hypothetical protein
MHLRSVSRCAYLAITGASVFLSASCSNDDHAEPIGNAGAAGSDAGAGGTDAAGDAASSSGGAPDARPDAASGGSDAGLDAGRDARGSEDSSNPPVERAACKRGLGYGYHSQADLTALSPTVAWWYNWSHVPDEALRDGSYRNARVEYVPMVWGGSFDVSRLTNEIPTGARALLGFNEPNFGEQANLSASQAAALWPNVQQIADARNLLLVSPAVNFCGGNCQDTDPFGYLDDFFAACTGCRVDAVAFHIYVGCNQSGANKAQWLINHVETYKQRFSQPLWLTEFACTDAASFAEQVAFLEDAVEYLENEPRIARYAWFSGRFPGIPFVNLLGADGELTSLGQAYVAAETHPDCPD